MKIVIFLRSKRFIHSRSLTADASGQLNIFGHNGNSLGVNGTQIGILKEADHVGFTGFLDGKDCLRLESQIALVLGGNFSNKSLEGQLANKQLCRLLKLSDFSEGDCAGSESVWLLNTFVSNICGFSCRFLG